MMLYCLTMFIVQLIKHHWSDNTYYHDEKSKLLFMSCRKCVDWINDHYDDIEQRIFLKQTCPYPQKQLTLRKPCDNVSGKDGLNTWWCFIQISDGLFIDQSVVKIKIGHYGFGRVDWYLLERNTMNLSIHNHSFIGKVQGK